MFKLAEEDQKFCLEYRSRMFLVATLGVLALSVLALVEGQQPFGAAVMVAFSAWASAMVYEKSLTCFDARTRQVQGQRRLFRKTQHFEVPFADIQGLALEHSSQNRYRMVLLTPSGGLPLMRTYVSDEAVHDLALRLQAWLLRHGVRVPLQERNARDGY